MAKRVQLPNGQVLEFPDDTPDEIINRVAREQMNIPTSKSAARQPPMGPLGVAKGVADVGLSSLRGIAHQLVGTGMGLGGAIHGGLAKMGLGGEPGGLVREDMSFMGGVNAYNQAAQDDQLTIKGSQLRTPEGQRVAQFIGNIPIGLPAQGGPNVGQVPRVRDIGEFIQGLGQRVTDVAGPEATNVLGSGITLATMRPLPLRPTGAAANAVRAAEESGYITPPTTVLGHDITIPEQVRAAATSTPPTGAPVYSGSMADRMARNWGGGADVDARIAMRNQQVTQVKAMEAAKLPEMTPQAHARSMAQNNAVYDVIKGLQGPGGTSLTVPLQSQSFYNRVLTLAKTPGWNSMARLPDAVERLKDDLLTVHPTVEGVVNRVRQLREDAFKNFDGDAEAQMLGRAQREAADILDDELRDRLQFISTSASDPNLRAIATRIFNEYMDARRQLSILHDIRFAMNPATGTIDASKIARLAGEGRQLAPQLGEIANAYAAYGGTGMQVGEKAMKTAGAPLGTAGDMVAGAVIGGHAGNLGAGGTGSLGGAVIGALAIPFSRYAAREFALRGPSSRALTGGVNNYVLKPGIRATVGGTLIGEDPQQ